MAGFTLLGKKVPRINNDASSQPILAGIFIEFSDSCDFITKRF